MPSLPPNFLDELRARTPLQPLVGRTVRLTRSGREHKGCCPFHGEKTPSFYVYDDHFHCFGCGEHGDAITWVMKSQNLPFMEAVETLARGAGLDVPRPSPQAAEAERKRAGLHEVLEAAARLYQRWLREPPGAAALGYLHGRGLTDETIHKFGLGWSGEGRGALAKALRGQGIATEQLVEAGLMKLGDAGPVDMFFSRVMFPIHDRRGGIIGFSGRILGDGQPKYVNGPETAVFSKRRSLYGLHLARDAVRKGAAMVLVEGQMDVIALHQAGFAGAVAPLGTALTEEQLAAAWRLSPEPVICFDADAAGRRAALKAADLALASLAPDRGLKFLALPDGEDPDSLLRHAGPAAFAGRLATAAPLSATLYDMLAEGADRATPEGRAGFRKRLEDTAARIADKALAGEYRAMLLDRFFAERRLGRAPRRDAGRRPVERLPLTPAESDQARAFVLTTLLLRFPAFFPDVEEAMAQLALPASCGSMMALLHQAGTEHDAALEPEALVAHLEGAGAARDAQQIMAVGLHHYPSMARLSAADLAGSFWHFYNLTPEARRSLVEQRDQALAHFARHQDDLACQQRIIKLAELIHRCVDDEVAAGP